MASFVDLSSIRRAAQRIEQAVAGQKLVLPSATPDSPPKGLPKIARTTIAGTPAEGFRVETHLSPQLALPDGKAGWFTDTTGVERLASRTENAMPVWARADTWTVFCTPTADGWYVWFAQIDPAVEPGSHTGLHRLAGQIMEDYCQNSHLADYQNVQVPAFTIDATDSLNVLAGHNTGLIAAWQVTCRAVLEPSGGPIGQAEGVRLGETGGPVLVWQSRRGSNIPMCVIATEPSDWLKTQVSVLGVDPGQVTTGMCHMVFDQARRTVTVRHAAVDGYGAGPPDSISQAVARAVRQAKRWPKADLKVVEDYIPRTGLPEDQAMSTIVALMEERKLARLNNAGIDQIVTTDMLKLLDAHNFSARSHHQDVRQAAKLCVLALLKNDRHNRMLAGIVADRNTSPWQIIKTEEG